MKEADDKPASAGPIPAAQVAAVDYERTVTLTASELDAVVMIEIARVQYYNAERAAAPALKKIQLAFGPPEGAEPDPPTKAE